MKKLSELSNVENCLKHINYTYFYYIASDVMQNKKTLLNTRVFFVFFSDFFLKKKLKSLEK